MFQFGSSIAFRHWNHMMAGGLVAERDAHKLWLPERISFEFRRLHVHDRKVRDENSKQAHTASTHSKYTQCVLQAL